MHITCPIGRERRARPLILLALMVIALAGCARRAEVTAPTWPPPAMPDTPAGNQVAGYLQAFNAGDRAALAAFVAEHMTPAGPSGGTIEDRKRSTQQLYETSRGLNVYHIEDAQEHELTILAQFRLTEEWRRMTFYVETEPPHLITGVRMEPTTAPTNAGTLSEAELGARLDAYVRRLAEADRFSGVVLLAKDGRPLFERAYGMANKEEQLPNTLATRFDVASAGKMFTAVAVAQLVEQGLIRYDAPFGSYLPDYPAPYAQQVTIDQLLTHRSGIVDVFADQERFAEVRGSANPQRDYLALFQNEPLRFTPGERFEYSNSNYILLGAIVERVSGQSYADYLHEHIFAPAGMAATALDRRAGAAPTLARGYTEIVDLVQMELTPGTRRPADGFAPAVGSAAGGAVSTAGDLLKFDQALRGHVLLSAPATEQLLADRVDYERPGYRYAYGFITRQAGDERIVGHSGGFPGVDAQVELYQGSGYTVIVLANYELVGEAVAMWLQQTIVGS